MTTTNERPRTDPYTGDNRTPHSTPLDIALAQIAALELNPLCSTEHAMKLVREDVVRIVRALARGMEGRG